MELMVHLPGAVVGHQFEAGEGKPRKDGQSKFPATGILNF
jgi:hypothetical protein